MISLTITNHDFQGSGEQGSVVMKFTQKYLPSISPKKISHINISHMYGLNPPFLVKIPSSFCPVLLHGQVFCTPGVN
jgi:hypothetical protein